MHNFNFSINHGMGQMSLQSLPDYAGKQFGLWMKRGQLSFVQEIYIRIQMFILKLGYGCILFHQQSKPDKTFL